MSTGAGLPPRSIPLSRSARSLTLRTSKLRGRDVGLDPPVEGARRQHPLCRTAVNKTFVSPLRVEDRQPTGED